MTPGKALKMHMSLLSDYEKGEILDYPQIYYLGLSATKIKGTPLQEHNFGFDCNRPTAPEPARLLSNVSSPLS